jgi:molybdate transport system substrate-binding protein
MARGAILALALASMYAVPQAAFAADLKILSGAGLAVPVRALAADFGARHAMTVTVTTDTAGGVQTRMEAGEAYDLVIGTTQVVETLAQKKLVAGDRFVIARMVEGLAVKAGAPKPGLADAAALKQTLLAAKSIAYVDPATGAVSGVFLLSVAAKLGIEDQVKAKAVLTRTGAAVPDAVAKGDAELGVTLISEMINDRRVASFALPDEVQMTTRYAASLSARPQNEAAKILLDELHGAKGRDAIGKSGLVPVNN